MGQSSQACAELPKNLRNAMPHLLAFLKPLADAGGRRQRSPIEWRAKTEDCNCASLSQKAIHTPLRWFVPLLSQAQDTLRNFRRMAEMHPVLGYDP